MRFFVIKRINGQHDDLRKRIYLLNGNTVASVLPAAPVYGNENNNNRLTR